MILTSPLTDKNIQILKLRLGWQLAMILESLKKSLCDG
jgi:hypothetical protein